MKIKNKFTYTFVAIAALLFFMFFSYNFVGGGVVGHAATSASSENVYTDVLDDLQKDPEFNVNDYPVKPKDYSIYVIQVAEGENGNLFLYTYQPCNLSRKLKATQINMSLSEEFTNPKLYELEFINSNDVFCKYLVKGVQVSSKAVRYYNIASIYRDWNKNIDGETGNNNTISQKAFSVGSVWCITELGGELKYYRQPTYVVNIIDPYVDYLIYIQDSSIFDILPPAGLLPSLNKMGIMDAHYLAFSTDWDIDRLLSADVHYHYRSATVKYNELFGFIGGGIGWGDIEYGADGDDIVTLKYTDSVSIEGTVFDKKRIYSWDRIQTVSDFIDSESNLTEETLNNLDGKQWVLRFVETERTQTETDVVGVYSHYKSEFTVVDKVAVLRLEFESDGVVYNIGAVSDEQSGDMFPGNSEKETKKTFWEWLAEKLGIDVTWLKTIAGVLLGLIILALLWPIISPLITAAVKGLVWLIALPFKAIAALIKRNKD